MVSGLNYPDTQNTQRRQILTRTHTHTHTILLFGICLLGLATPLRISRPLRLVSNSILLFCLPIFRFLCSFNAMIYHFPLFATPSRCLAIFPSRLCVAPYPPSSSPLPSLCPALSSLASSEPLYFLWRTEGRVCDIQEPN